MSGLHYYKDLVRGVSRAAAAPLSRRTFLRASATASGGMVLALTVGCKRKPREEAVGPEGIQPPEPGADLNAWIHLEADGRVVMRIAESEMGQGVLTALSMILAEELDADWSKVSAEHAPCDANLYGRQGTGGSSSIRQGWEPMKKAGATARGMLLAAAADRLKVPEEELTTEPSLVVHAKSGQKLPYGSLAAAAARIELRVVPKPKDPSTYRLVGKAVARLDAPAKITGAAVYGLDVRLPGMKFAVIARPPALGSAVARFDAQKALAVPGVEQVLQVPSGVAVVAQNTWAALRGRDALTIEWTAGSHPALSSASITEALAAGLTKDAKPATAKEEGKATAALAKAQKRVAATYEVPYLAHATMEPLNCTVQLESGRCKVWTGTQAPTRAQKTAADAAGLTPEQVEIHTTFLGGGFGRRSQVDFITEAVHVAKEAKVPVQLVYTREDDNRAGFYRPAAMASMEVGLDAKGAPVAWVHRISSPSILEKLGGLVDGIDQSSVEGVANLPYAVPAKLVTWANPSLPLSTWFWRSVGSSQNAWMVESFLDEVARAAGRDPLEYRRELLAKQPRHLAVLEKAAAMSGWGKELPSGRARGLAVHESFGSYVALVAEVSLGAPAPGAPAASGPVPRVHKLWCAVDAGRIVNPNTVVAQMESGLIYGLSAALYGKIDLAGGAITTSQLAHAPPLRVTECPEIETVILESSADPGGVGEPSTPVVAPAVCNALLALTGKPVRKLPIVTIG